MESKQPAPTRSSSRTKNVPAVAAQPPRTTRTRAATTKASTPAVPTVAKKTASRKPLLNRENAIDVPPTATKPGSKASAATRKLPSKQHSNEDREPIMAYLRIRPHLGDDESVPQPYLTPLSDTAVRMTDPHDHQNNLSRFRPSALPPSSIYTFSHVFPPDTSQSDFFTKTTLPLVRDVLQGQNGLLFTYGVTNSGKTYTVQGGAKEGSAGILPRTLDVIYNSIEGLHGDGRFRPVRLHGVEPAEPTDSKPPPITPEPALAEVLGQHLDVSAFDIDIDPTTLKVDRNYEYTVWISYAEVYNEKVYDLLASVKDDSPENVEGSIPRANTGKSLLLTRTALPLKPSPASDNADITIKGKYIAGLRQFRVHSASQAKALVKLGQLHRRVFGTLANRESSRSHGMVIIKIIRGHRGERDDPAALQISRLTLVDLAGSERTKHTHTTGDRLREAGNINKSLMVLGQCMDVMRTNQRKLAISLSQEGVGKEGRMDTRDVKKGLAVVPFRHSKLTEALMDYFIGDGRAVMIVNVNPYDTGYDENSHVMKFAALAREVYITPAPAPVHRIPNSVTGLGKPHGLKGKEVGPLTLKGPDIAPNPYRRKVTISMGSGTKSTEAILEVLEEDEPNDEPDEDYIHDDPINPLVDTLFDEIESLRMQLFEAEMRCAIVEAETREEVMREMEGRMRSMEKMYSKRLMAELEQNELKTDAKIDMLHQSGLFGSPAKKAQPRRVSNDTLEEENDVEECLIETNREGEKECEDFALTDDESDSTQRRLMSLSPLSKKVQANQTNTTLRESWEPRKFVSHKPLPPNENTKPIETEQDGEYDNVVTDDEFGGREYNDAEQRDDYDEEDWAPTSSAHNNRIPHVKTKTTQRMAGPSLGPHLHKRSATLPDVPLNKVSLSKLQQEMEDLSIDGPDDSVIIIPTKKYRAHLQKPNHDEYDDIGAEVHAKKKKRQLGKMSVMTEEQIEKATIAVTKNDNLKHIKRLSGR
ncbi:P-loop containing nucleoside triphosphate hydrolase protein [Collybia nuda]|uniref:Kinesin-like protein n=1 Tax=Collybia nuda TaxID=64659 RepID=A0A9P6CEV0_9AGAR|nr:P-loop containing nucleoside triphosphate hydrolase protein [Collybia nuda]